MSSCLGIYVEDNIIKYAKISKERDIVKMETSGIRFYDNLESTLEQIVNETYSYKVPISINLSNEKYNSFEMFSLLSENDMKKAIDTEFELLCEEKGYNKNTLESRYVLANIPENREKIKAIHISANRAEITKKIQQLQKYSLRTIVPLPITIANNIEIGVKENSAIINLEATTTITTILNGQVNKVSVLEHGMEEIFEKIENKENSYAKMYEILKETTIYTMEGKNLQEETNDYLEDIMPTLYNILNEAKEILTDNIYTIDKLYITGTGAVINNVDLYFQEFFMNTKCEILKPYFIKNVNISKENIKDYIEVNSAISIALQGLGEGIKDINFKGGSSLDKIKDIMNIKIGGSSQKKQAGGKEKFKLKFDLNESLDVAEKQMLRLVGGILLAIIIYVVGSTVISNMITDKKTEVESVIADTKAQIAKVDADIQTLNSKTSQYNTLIKNLEEINTKVSDENSRKNIIPNLLNGIMYRIARGAQITSIENTTDRHIVISAQAANYDQLGYFLARIKEQGILINVKSNSGVVQNGVIRMTIEGDMP